jgi:hypothetical protein
MSSGELQQLDALESEAGSAEVEFALVLARMITSVNGDPEQLRQAIYDLARHKLDEQFTSEDVQNVDRTKTALERAIRGVEAFARHNDDCFAAPPRPQLQSPAAQMAGAGSPTAVVYPPITKAPSPLIAYHPASDDPIFKVGSRVARRRRWSWSVAAAAVMIVVCGAVAIVRQKPALLPSLTFVKAEKPAAAESAKESAKSNDTNSMAKTAGTTAAPSPLIPTVYGVYAVSDNKLQELSMLPGRAPDLRVAISPTIGAVGHAAFYGGHPRFIVYRREAASSVPERADVRIIAKISRETSFDAAGKPTVASDDGWAIRNISFPYRTAPSKDNPEMYEILPEESGAELTAGRYALVLKGQLYDFTVAGAVVDPRHCLERLKAANGTFMSECRKP